MLRSLLLVALVALPDVARPCSPPEPMPLVRSGTAALGRDGLLHLVIRQGNELSWATTQAPWEVSMVRASIEVGACDAYRGPRAFLHPTDDRLDVIAPCGELVSFSDAGAVLVTLPYFGFDGAGAIAFAADGSRLVAGQDQDGMSLWRELGEGGWSLVARLAGSWDAEQIVVEGDQIYVANQDGFWRADPVSQGFYGMPFAAGSSTVYDRVMGLDQTGEIFFAWLDYNSATHSVRLRHAARVEGGFAPETVASVAPGGDQRVLASPNGEALAVVSLESSGWASAHLARRDGTGWALIDTGRGHWFDYQDYSGGWFGALQLMDDGTSIVGGAIELRLVAYDGASWQSQPIAVIGERADGSYAYHCGGDDMYMGCAASSSGALATLMVALGLVLRAARRRRWSSEGR